MTSLILPAFNPGATIVPTWQAVERFLLAQARRGDPWEAVLVLDGCTDDTAERVADLASQPSRIRVVSYPMNRGKGFAVRTGLLAARGTIRIFTDVDLAYPFDDVLRVATVLRAGAAVAIGSRTHPASRIQVAPAALGYAVRRMIQGRLFGAVARQLLPLHQRDTQAGLKGLTAEAAEWLVPQLVCDGFEFDCELLTACAYFGIPVVEVPVCVRYQSAASTTGVWSGVRMLANLWRIRRRWRVRRDGVVIAQRLADPATGRPRLPSAA